jgi:hypothetical protein
MSELSLPSIAMAAWAIACDNSCDTAFLASRGQQLVSGQAGVNIECVWPNLNSLALCRSGAGMSSGEEVRAAETRVRHSTRTTKRGVWVRVATRTSYVGFSYRKKLQRSDWRRAPSTLGFSGHLDFAPSKPGLTISVRLFWSISF